MAPWLRHCAGFWRKFNVCPRLILRSPVHYRLATGLPYDPLGGEFLCYLQKHKPERLAIHRSFRISQATEIASIKTKSTENYTKLQGSNSVSESLGRRNIPSIPSDEHACIYWDKWAFLYKKMFRSEKSKLPIHRLRSFFGVLASAEGVRRYFLHKGQKFYKSLPFATVEQL